jgi:hypothetical protein
VKCSPWQALTCPKPGAEPRDKRYQSKPSKQTANETTGKQAPEFTPIPIVFNLCSTVDSGGITRKFVEEYSGYTGFHIRTIPGNRWHNPQMIAAGYSVLAVLDRFNNLDMVRITDKYGGAGAAGFDSDGFPLDSVQWDSLADDHFVRLPTDYTSTGICVVERGTVLANLITPAGKFFVYRYQIGSTLSLLNDSFSLEAYGTPIGSPVGLYSRPGEQMYLAASLVQTEAGYGVIVYDWLQEEPVAMMGLPDDWTPVSLGEANNVVSVLLSQGSTTKILRFPININTAVASGGNRGDVLPAPASWDVSTTFQPVDPGYQQDDLVEYNETTQDVHKGFGRNENYPEPTTAEVSQIVEGGRRLASGTTTGELNDDRSQAFETYQSNFYGQDVKLRANMIENPAATTVIGLCSSFGSICEALRPSDDAEAPVFRMLEGKNYEFISNGGFVYGCADESADVGVTSSYTTISVAVDVGYERGALKDLPDLKVALVDSLNGRFIFMPPKPFLNEDGNSYRAYAGEYAGLQIPAESTIARSPCTTTEEATAEAIDGIDRPGHTRPNEEPAPEQFSVDTEDLDAPWNFFLRRAILGSRPTLAPVVKSWSTHQSDGITQWEEWQNSDSIATVSLTDKLFWPPVSANVAERTTDASCRSGFFALNYPKEQTTTHQYARDQISELQAQNASGSLSAAQIAANNAQIAAYEEQIATTDDELYYLVPQSITNLRFTRLEGSQAQELEAPTVANDYDQSDQMEIPDALTGTLTPWTVTTIQGLDRDGDTDNLRRGIVIEPTIRSWIGVDVLLNRLGSITDGVEGYRNQAFWGNGLGKNVGGNAFGENGDIFNPSCHDAALVYEAGYRAGDGALGVWEFDVLLDGRPASAVATRVTNTEQISQLAPTDAQGILAATLAASGGVGLLGMREGRVYYTDLPVTNVTIRARLINYAYGVFRVGYRTVHRNDSAAGIGDSICPGADPGFALNNACADCCGNITCTSSIFFGNKLYADDPMTPVTRQIIWQGEASFTVESDPYADEYNLSMGRVIDGYLELQLNNTIAAYSVDISQNQ